MTPTINRWRLVLGQFAKEQLKAELSADELRREAALDFLYSREYAGRGIRNHQRSSTGSLDASQLSIPSWLSEVRDLFPRETVEIIEQHAIDRYGLTEILSDPQTLENLTPNIDLLKALLTFRNHLRGPILDIARRIVRQVVEEIKRKLETEIRRALTGRMNRFRHSAFKVAQAFDWRTTIRRNLKYYDPKQAKLILQDPRFFARNTRLIPWDIILCIDQSGSMGDSVIHSAVMASILSSLPSLKLKLFVFDTSIVDLTNHVDDPIEVLMNVQLGGGTNIGQALRYCEKRIESPHRTILILISDFCEGASLKTLYATVQRLSESGITLIGLAALDQTAHAVYDKNTASHLADLGMHIAALTPKHLAEWIAKHIGK